MRKPTRFRTSLSHTIPPRRVTCGTKRLVLSSAACWSTSFVERRARALCGGGFNQTLYETVVIRRERMCYKKVWSPCH